MTLVGMWLIFGPPIPYMLFLAYMNLEAMGVFGPQDGWEHVQSDGLFWDISKMFLTFALIALDSAILWKMTLRWIRSRRQLPSGSM
ncbi:MAG: hypothetical protein WC869_05415 [Phycisphaerae bacterium]